MSDLVLGIDTTGRGGAVALASSAGILGVEVHDPELGYAEELFGLFDRVFAGCGRQRSELSAVAVLSGPGSFTGLRIGVMTAKTVAFGLGIPLLAAPTLELLAMAGGPGHKLAVADAGGGHVWSQEFEVSDDRLEAVSAVTRMKLEGLVAGDREVVAMAPLIIGTQLCDLAGPLALRAVLGQAPVREVDRLAMVPEYVSISQAERTHGLDLSEELRRPIEPRGWDP